MNNSLRYILFPSFHLTVTCTYVYLTPNALICIYRLLSTLQVWLWLDAKLHYVAFTLVLLAMTIKLNLTQYFDSTLMQMWTLLEFKGKKEMDRMGADQMSYIPLCDAIANCQFQSIFIMIMIQRFGLHPLHEREIPPLWLLFLPCQNLLFFPSFIFMSDWHKHDNLPWHNRWDSGQLVAVARTGSVSCKVAAAAAL